MTSHSPLDWPSRTLPRRASAQNKLRADDPPPPSPHPPRFESPRLGGRQAGVCMASMVLEASFENDDETSIPAEVPMLATFAAFPLSVLLFRRRLAR